MNKVLTLVIVLCLCILDLAITTIIYCHGNKFGTVFSHSLNAYVYSTSLLELWCFVIIRTSVILGLIIGIIVNTDTGVLRVKSSQLIATYCICISCMYTIIKLLVLAEKLDNLNSIWVKGLFAWSLGAAVLFIIQWKLLGKINSPRLLRLNVNCDESEAKPLLCDRNPNDSNKNGKEKKADMFSRSTVLRLVALSKPDWLWILTGFTFLSLASAGEIFVPFFTGKVVDGIVIDKSEKEFSKAVIIMALISAGSAIAAGIRGGCLFIVIERLNIRIRNLLFSSILRQEIGFFDTVQSGEITSRLTSDTTTMSDALGLNINIFLRNLIKAVGVLFFMIKLSWRLTMVTVIGLPCILTVSSVYGKYYKKLAEQVQDSLAEANNVAEEACSSMRTVRSFANEQGEVNRYADKLGVTYKLNKKQAVMYSGFVWCSNLFELALTVSVLYYGGHLVIKGTLTGGRLISFILYQIQLGSCVSEMGNVYTGLMEAAGASEKVFSYIDRKPKIIPTGKLAPETINGRIEFKNVNFNYPSRPDVPVLKDMNLTVSPGEVVALVGPSGGGKTSCVNLLEHFYAALSGEVLVDNVPIHEYDHHFIHKQISLVGQEPILYARTIEENIRYGLEEGEWSQDEIMVASQMANAHRFIMEMKDGYNTQTGEKGVQMSGGQKQRVAIARALIRKPKVLLLDEATSALDAESEFLVQQALYQNMSGRTVIIIAHRLSTVERADRILVIDKGTVVEQGTHQQLLEKKGLYTSLVKRQMLISESSYNDLRTAQMSECSCGRRRRVSSSGRHNSGNKPTLERENSMPRAIFIVGSA